MKDFVLDILQRPLRLYWTFRTMLLMCMGRLYIFRNAPFWFLGYAAAHAASDHEETARWGSLACQELMLRLQRLERALDNGEEPVL